MTGTRARWQASLSRALNVLLLKGVVSRNRRKFRHSAGSSTSELVNALGKESEGFVHILQCLGFCALRA